LKIARNVSLLVFAAGLVMLLVGVACGGSSNKKEEAQTASTPADTATATATATATSTPSPTPTPFNGAVKSIQIPSLKVNAPVDPATVNSNNEMETPPHGKELTDVVWYDSTLKADAPYLGAKPGWDGNAVFAAHVYYGGILAPFGEIAPLYGRPGMQVGDEIDVTMADGTVYKYKMVKHERFNRDTIPMGDVINPPDRPEGKQWITLITCGGALDATGQEYVSRDVIVAERMS
jgi:sortase (surface protein transpeptidase)